MLKVGLTGGIGSGKSTVAARFAAYGVPVLDADLISRELVEPGQPALDAIAQRFGPAILDQGRLDRERLRALIFAAPQERRWLEALLHPMVYAEMRRRMDGLGAPYCLLMVPLLLETGQRGFVDRLLVVDCPPEAQRRRVALRDGVDPAHIERILATQASRAERLAAADDIIDNSGSEAALSAAVARLHRHYLSLGRDGRKTSID
jgi:dephospho-CoA kinase